MGYALPREIYRSWPAGVLTSPRAEDLPPQASPRGRNSTLVGVGPGTAVPAKRRGATPLLLAAEALGTLAPAPLTLATAHSQHAYRRNVAGTYTYTHLAVVKESGDLFEITPAGVSTLRAAGLFGANGPAPGWATFKNSAFALGGSVRKKVLAVSGTLTAQNLGIVRPPARATTSFNWNATAGGTGGMTGDYELALTFWNDTAQTESSRSDGYTVTGAASDQLTVTWATSPDTQITHVRVHIRKVGTNVDFLRVTAGTGVVAGKGVPIATGTTVLDLSDAALLTYEASPDTLEHNPPAVDASGASIDDLYGGLIHGGRLLVWSKTGFYYSKYDQPEQFDPESFEPVNPDDGQELVTCHKVSDDLVLIFKRHSLWALVGNDPNSWSLELLDPSVGCVAPNSVVTIEGKTYWWSELGPMVWSGGGAPTQLGYQLLRETTDPAQTNAAAWPGIVAHVDPPRQQLVFWIPSAGSLVNDQGLPFNYRLGVFESDGWTAVDVASAVSGEDAEGRPVVLLGGYYGRLYTWWTADTDGARTANAALQGFTLSGLVFASTSTEVTLSGTVSITAAFAPHAVILSDNTGTVVRRRLSAAAPSASPNGAVLTLTSPLPDGFTPTAWTLDLSFTLHGAVAAAATVGSYTRLFVEGAVFDTDLVGHTYASLTGGGRQDVQRRRIVAVGTAGTQGYVDVYPVLDADPSAAVGLTLNVAAPCFEWDTPWSDSGEPFKKKRYLHSHLAAACGQGRTEATLELFTGYDLLTPSRTRTYTINTAGALWDDATFDVAVFGGGEGRNTFRTAVGRLANSYRLRVRNCEPNRQFVLLGLGMDVTLLGDRR